MFRQHKIKRVITYLYLFVLLLSLFILQITGQSSGGTYTVQKSVVAGGGATSSGGIFSLSGTAGQSAAGGFSQNTTFNIRSGFWASDVQAPTAGESIIAGSVTDVQSGEGIGGVKIILTDLATGEPQVTKTNSKGDYAFTEVMVGKFYMVTAAHRNYTTVPSQQLVSLAGDTTGLNFVATKDVSER